MLKKELILDNLGVCRFHRGWAEDMVPEVMESLYGMKDAYLSSISVLASRINSRNASIVWESERDFDFVYTFLKRKSEVENDTTPGLEKWIAEFEKDKNEAGLNFWFEMLKGIDESLRDFQ